MNTERAQHTPGPWMTRDGTNIYGKRRDVGYVTCIANAGSFSSNEVDTDAENQANARLIAAAPELLMATERLSGAIESLLIGCAGAAVPNAIERQVLQESVNAAILVKQEVANTLSAVKDGRIA